jgi:A/G-specific adenine glycosylase
MEDSLLAWFEKHGRELPWRRTRDPYSILVSEVMLQQTQVPRVIPRYLEWLERWPTVGAFAAAPRDAVIRQWQGLGYNRRAVNLHRAAQIVTAEGWPDDLTELPGVGVYTAAAVRRFALGEAVLPIDTNIRRVLERSRGEFGPESAAALMDLGATVCLARIPRCDECPLVDACPSRGRRYEPLRKQSRFEGSFRERRAKTLRLVAAGRTTGLDGEAVASLEQDGLVEVRAGLARLSRYCGSLGHQALCAAGEAEVVGGRRPDGDAIRLDPERVREACAHLVAAVGDSRPFADQHTVGVHKLEPARSDLAVSVPEQEQRRDAAQRVVVGGEEGADVPEPCRA